MTHGAVDVLQADAGGAFILGVRAAAAGFAGLVRGVDVVICPWQTLGAHGVLRPVTQGDHPEPWGAHTAAHR